MVKEPCDITDFLFDRTDVPNNFQYHFRFNRVERVNMKELVQTFTFTISSWTGYFHSLQRSYCNIDINCLNNIQQINFIIVVSRFKVWCSKHDYRSIFPQIKHITIIYNITSRALIETYENVCKCSMLYNQAIPE